ncbi:hypothetical protein FZEAL_10108 [Fusarium zealandicum]|uniref:2-dehydropantoate 2-reductase n=1 Tax=Fusarium zealandicum TaxID=1053134 RepID=A0A8H4U596_9HYPO|nr:hypothetical protein FZEAL_10108 [Fusarium zealandicum]
MDKARILLVGCGGIGCMAALNLEYGGRAAVTAVLRSSYRTVKESGFTINSVDHGQVRGFRPTEILSSVPDVSQLKIAPFDYIICATKNMPDVGPPIADLVRPAVTPGHSAILLLQNGLNIEAPLFEAFPDNPILSGISICGSSEPVSGTIEHTLHDELRVGPFRDEPVAADRARDFVARYASGRRCTCHYDSNVALSRWRKLLYNAVYNPVGALTDLDTGDIQVCPGLIDDIVRPAMKEIQAAAAAYGQDIPDDAIEAILVTEPIDAHVPPSMLVDARKKQYIELENLIGEPLRAAKARQVPTPILQSLYSLARSYQWKTRVRNSA